MTNRVRILFFATCLVVGCAQPKYESAKPGKSDVGGSSEKASDCVLKLKSKGLCLTWAWQNYPTSSVAGSLVFKTYRGNVVDDSPVLVDLEAAPTVLLWMPSMGHGSTPTKVARVDVGTYLVSDVFFVMPGDWEIHYQLRNGGDVVDEAIATLTF